MKMETCIKRIFGKAHKFKPRYNTVAPAWMSNMSRINGHPERSYDQIYVCDVCIYCGKVVFKNK